MSYLVLARKYRPQTFDQVVSQEHVTQTLTNAISADRVAHAVLFSGPRGTGKTTVARILAKAMNCNHGPTPVPCNDCRSCREITVGSAPDVFEIDGASNNSVDQIRDLRENIRYMPAHGRYKIYIIDEVHMLSIAAFNALLKTLEEPPPHVMFIFATTESHKIPVTILSRCQRHDFRRININSILKHLEMICAKEGFSIGTESLWQIAREADGSIRDALSLLDQVLTSAQETLIPDQVLSILGILDRKIIFDISKAVLREDMPALLGILDDVYDQGQDMKKLYLDLVEHFRNLLVVKMGRKIDKLVDLPTHEVALMLEQVKDVSVAALNQILDLFFKEEASIRLSAQPKLALEMAFIRMFQVQPVLPIDALIEKLDTLQKEVSQDTPGGADAAARESLQGKKPGLKESSNRSAPAEGSPAPIASDKPNSGPDLEKTWKKLLDVISEKYPALATNLATSTLIKLTDHSLEIEVNGNGFSISMIRRDKNVATLKRVCSEFFGKKMDLVIKAKVVQSDDTQQKKSQDSRLKQEALRHPLVAETVEIFNGTVVDVKLL